MCVCVCKGTNKLHTHLHTHTRECDKGSVVGLSAGVEIRSCGNGAGELLLVLVLVGGCWGLEETGGCSTARYGVTTSKNPIIARLYNTAAAQTVLIRHSRELAVEGELQHCNAQVSNHLTDIHLRIEAKLSKDEDKNER